MIGSVLGFGHGASGYFAGGSMGLDVEGVNAD
jgi:hypothetical protein